MTSLTTTADEVVRMAGAERQVVGDGRGGDQGVEGTRLGLAS
jgi:hypothetical protein